MAYNPYATNNNNPSAPTYNNSGYSSSQGSPAYVPSSQGSAPYVPSSQGSSPYAPSSQVSSPYVPASQGSSPYAPSSQVSAPYIPSSQVSSPYVPSSQGSSPYVPSSQIGGYQTSLSSPPPPLSNLLGWFDHYDLDRGGTLDKEELVHALIQTAGVTSAVEQANIRETVINVFAAFDSNGSGSICKREFCAPDGLGQSLQAAMQQYPSNAGASAQMYQNSPSQNPQPSAPYEWKPPDQPSYAPQAPQPQRHQQQQQQQQQFQLMRSPIPNGMQPGQQLQVRVGPAGSLMVVTIPDRRNWIMGTNNGQQSFEFRIPASPSPSSNLPDPTKTYVPQGTNQNMSQQVGSQLYQGMNQNTHQQQVSQMQHYSNVGSNTTSQSAIHRQEWQSFERFERRQYQPPPLRVETVSIPPSFDFIRASGRRKALLIGINYTGTRAALRGCINDARNIKKVLLRQGFPDDSSHMVVLTDDSSSNYSPTSKNIFKAIQWLVQGVSQGDILFFHFSGHGAQVPDKTGQEADGMNETILPLDYKHKQITDDELWGSLVYPLPSGVKLTAIMDCCHSGTGLDLPFDYKIGKKKGFGERKGGKWMEEVNPAHSRGDVCLFSGCEDSQTSADTVDRRGKGSGAMTQSFIDGFERNGFGGTYTELLASMYDSLKRRGFSQKPQLTTSQKFNAEERIFSFIDHIEPNRNRKIGRIKRKHIKPGRAGGNRGGGDIDNFLFGGALGKIAGLAAGAAVLGMIFD